MLMKNWFVAESACEVRASRSPYESERPVLASSLIGDDVDVALSDDVSAALDHEVLDHAMEDGAAVALVVDDERKLATVMSVASSVSSMSTLP